MISESITMQAFGSYVKKNTITFDKLNENGLFVICGNTGSGKTTILDAISVALYGKSTGGERSFKELRNTSAPDEIPTIVEYIFSLGEQRYKFIRKLFISFKKRKKEFELKSEHECFKQKCNIWELIDSSSESGVRSVAEKVLGLDCNQFAKVVMLPQGEFKNLLVSSSTDKAKILTKLFATEKWEKITEKIKSMSDEKGNYIKAKLISKERILKEHSVCNIEELKTYCKKTFNSLQEEKLFQKEILGKIKETNNKMDLIKEINSIREHNLQIEKKLSKAKKEFEDKQNSLNEINNSLMECKSLKKLEQKLILEISELEKSYVNIESLSKIKEQKLQLSKILNNTKNKIKSLKKSEKNTSESLKDLKEEAFEIEKKITSISDLSILNEKLKLDYEKYLEAQEIQNELSELHLKFNNKKSDFKLEELKLNSLKEEYNNLEEKIILNKCISLSDELKPGKPCPICGSVSHPNPASMKISEKNINLKENLFKLKNDIEKAEKEMTSQKEALIKILSTIELKTAALNKSKEILLNKYDNFQNLILQVQNTQKSLDDANLSSKKLSKLRDEIKELDKKHQLLNDEIKNSINEISQNEANFKVLSEQENLLYKNIPLRVTDKDELKCAIDSKKEEKLLIEKKISNFENSLNELKSTFTISKLNYENLKKEYLNASEQYKSSLERSPEISDIAVTDLSEKLNMLHVENEKSLQKIGCLSQTYECLMKNAKYLKEIELEINENQYEYSKIEKLYQLLSGSNIKKIPIKMFVLGMALDEILSRANIYLSNLSRRRYSLSRKADNTSGRAYSGLDIEVFDAYLGAIRTISTLSGGELFLASLALAFGLSDVIQSNSGGIRIDSLFIDEGFGSLDYDTLNTVIEALNDVKKNGRIIGIISHIDEIKNRISAKIEIKNNNHESISYVKIG